MIAVRFISFWTEAIRLHPAFSSAAAREQGVLPFFLWTFLDQGDRVAVIYIFLKSLNPHFTPTRLACSI
jgi:hypothetical protein